MKRLTTVLLLFVVLALGYPAYAEGFSVVSDSGDEVRILDDVEINRKTTGNIIVILGDADIRDEVAGDIVVIIGDATINAKVTGDVVNVLGRTRLKEKAEISGDVVSIGSLEKLPGSMVRGEEVSIYGRELHIDIGVILLARLIGVIVFSFVVLILGLIMIAASKEKLHKMIDDFVPGMARKTAIGFLGLIGAFIIFLLLFVTVVIPLLYFVLMLIAGVFSGIYLGRVILNAFGSARSSIYLEFITGIITVTIIKVGLVYFLPLHEFLLSVALFLAFSIFIDSLGIGILLNWKLNKKQQEKI